MRYSVEITETLSRIIAVDAKSVQHALEIAQDAYYSGQIILDDSDFDNDPQFEIIDTEI